MPEYGIRYPTRIFRSISTSIWRRHQRGDLDQLLWYPKYHRSTTRLQNIQFSINEPLVTFNHRYEVIHKVAFRMSPSEQESKTVIVEYTKKLPANTRDKLLRKIAKKNSYIKTLNDAFKQALDINRETSFVVHGKIQQTERHKNRNPNKRIKWLISGIRCECNEHQVNKQIRRQILEWIIQQIIKQK